MASLAVMTKKGRLVLRAEIRERLLRADMPESRNPTEERGGLQVQYSLSVGHMNDGCQLKGAMVMLFHNISGYFPFPSRMHGTV